MMAFEPLVDKLEGVRLVRAPGRRQRSRCRRGGLRRGAYRILDHSRAMIVADTLMGKGVPFLEQREKNHFIRVEPHEWQLALAELDAGRQVMKSASINYASGKPRLTTSAMIASIAAEGQRTKPAPFGHALVELARNAARSRRHDRRSRQVHRPAHLRESSFPTATTRWAWRSSCCSARPRAWRPKASCPFATTYAVFASRRAYDFIHQTIAEEDRNVKIVCALPGLTSGYGPSHQAAEDLALFRAMPNMTVIDPCDAHEIEQTVPPSPPIRARCICACCAARCRSCSTSTTTSSSSARRSCSAMARRADHLDWLHEMRALEAAKPSADNIASRCCMCPRSSRSTRRPF